MTKSNVIKAEQLTDSPAQYVTGNECRHGRRVCAICLDDKKINELNGTPAEYDANMIDKVAEKFDNVHQPSHYIRNGLECIDAIKAAVEGLDGFEGYCIGNVVKYAWRWKQKNGLEDVRKAKRYLEILEEYRQGG